jgi:AcrR family transcriptional regulator
VTLAPQSLRGRQTTATREQIVSAAFELLTDDEAVPFSHEAVATRAAVGVRTVYRYFPSQMDLFQALWVHLRERIPPEFPTKESELAVLADRLFKRFDDNEQVIRTLLSSPAGTQVRDRGSEEGRSAFTNTLASLTSGCSDTELKRIVAVFVSVYSAPFWQLLRGRGGLTGPEARAAVAWTMEALISELRQKKGKSTHVAKKGK